MTDNTYKTWLKPSDIIYPWKMTFMKDTIINKSFTHNFPIMPNMTGFQSYQIKLDIYILHIYIYI